MRAPEWIDSGFVSNFPVVDPLVVDSPRAGLPAVAVAGSLDPVASGASPPRTGYEAPGPGPGPVEASAVAVPAGCFRSVFPGRYYPCRHLV